jgi:hypothetical protein
MGALNPPVLANFATVQRLLCLFAQGLTGRYLRVEMSDARWPCYTDPEAAGDSLLLPEFIDDFPAAEHNFGAYRIGVLRQIVCLDATKLEFDWSRWLRLSRRPRLLRRIFAALESLRVDSTVGRLYPGARADLDRVQSRSFSRRPSIERLPPLASLLEALLQYCLGRPREALRVGDMQALTRIIDEAAAVGENDADAADSARAAAHIVAILESMFARASRAGARGELTHLPGAPATGPVTPVPDARIPLLPAHRAVEAAEVAPELACVQPQGGPCEESSGEMLPGHESGRHGRGQSGMASSDASRAADGAAPGCVTASCAAVVRPPRSAQPRSFLYDEWDHQHATYLTAWCRVFEHRLRGEDVGFLDAVHRRHAALARQIRRQFTCIRPESWERVRRTDDGEELELDRIIEAVIDRRAGQAIDPSLYTRRDRARRDVAAALLVDMSASTDFPVPERSTGAARALDCGPRRRVLDVAKDSLALMGEALCTLGDSFAIYGFSGDGREDVEFNVAKDFHDPVSPQTWAALAAMQPRCSTRMGPAIRHALNRLTHQPENMKVLIIVSDGYPEDRDYGPDRNDTEYGIKDTARALREAQAAGVMDFCITIDPAGHDYLKRMCTASRYLVIDDVDALPRELIKVYRALTV